MRYSKQREEIKKFINETKIHPNADDVYNYIKVIIPDISLGTIYRNLGSLVDSNEIRSIVIPGEAIRYDNNCINHYHIKCNVCKSIHDISCNYIKNINDIIESESKFIVTSHDIIFVGICQNCIERGN